MNKSIILFVLLLSLCFNCGEPTPNSNETAKENAVDISEEKKAEFAIIIHGGAGTILKKNMTPEKEAAYKAKLEEAIRVGITF